MRKMAAEKEKRNRIKMMKYNEKLKKMLMKVRNWLIINRRGQIKRKKHTRKERIRQAKSEGNKFFTKR